MVGATSEITAHTLFVITKSGHKHHDETKLKEASLDDRQVMIYGIFQGQSTAAGTPTCALNEIFVSGASVLITRYGCPPQAFTQFRIGTCTTTSASQTRIDPNRPCRVANLNVRPQVNSKRTTTTKIKNEASCLRSSG